MKAYLLVSMLFLTACGQNMMAEKDPHPNPGTGPEFAVFVHQFEADYGISIGNFPIMFGDQSGNVIGVCQMWSDGYRQIQIDPGFWNNTNVSDARRKALIYHELGHCILNRGHDDAYIPSATYGSIPRSIMNSYLRYELAYPDLQPYYINELFHPGSTSVAVPDMEDSDCVEHMD